LNNKHKVYLHLFPNGKRYYGYTCKDLNTRFGKNGIGYSYQPLIWNAIQKYGWQNIEHILIGEFNTEKEAKSVETKMIRRYFTNNPLYGYNVAECDSDVFVQKYFLDTELMNNNSYVNIYNKGLLNYSRCRNDVFNCDDTKRYFDENDLILNVYHRFNTTRYSGLIFVDIDSDDTVQITEEAFNTLSATKSFIFYLKALYGVNDDFDFDFDDISELRIGYGLKFVYSIFDGEFRVHPDINSKTDYVKICKVKAILNKQKNILKDNIDDFRITENFRNKDDSDILRMLKNDIITMKNLNSVKE